MSAPNRNTFYAEAFVNALARAGLQAVCIAPGSRSTPLTLAFAKHPHIQVYSHLDERSASFFALGMAMASDQPVALVCTSGTAAANFHPAIIEAYMSRVPLLVLTADRPPELRHSGANQTIDQVKMYGNHVLWSVDMALPESDPPAVAIRNLYAMAARAYATADGRMDWRRKGPVHLNFPFRKPLEPVAVPKDVTFNIDAALDVVIEKQMVSDSPLEGWSERFETHERGVIIFGGDNVTQDDLEAISAFATRYGYPVLAEPLSGMRFRSLNESHSLIVSGYDSFMDALPQELLSPDLILRFGAVPTSKALNQYITRADARYRIAISRDGVWQDDAHLTTHQLPITSHRQLLPQPFTREGARVSDWLDRWTGVEAVTQEHLRLRTTDVFFDGGVVAQVVARLQRAGNGSEPLMFVGNSSPIRHLEQFTMAAMSTIRVFASRGASGIDGQVSTALGIGAARGEHIYAILGDITFYHDMNGLLAVRRNNVSATFIVLNNNGGGIFERLPIRDFEPYHTEHFLTPHGLTFEHAAAMYGLEYAVVDDFASLDVALGQYLKPGVSSIIEVRTDIKQDEARRKEIVRLVSEQVRQELNQIKERNHG